MLEQSIDTKLLKQRPAGIERVSSLFAAAPQRPQAFPIGRRYVIST